MTSICVKSMMGAILLQPTRTGFASQFAEPGKEKKNSSKKQRIHFSMSESKRKRKDRKRRKRDQKKNGKRTEKEEKRMGKVGKDVKGEN